ncbi:hypothetical protein GGR45_000131 [Sphingomonas zeae]|jgi:hypothetical protein|nr:hypothetical protein [Sphingomonas zeae]
MAAHGGMARWLTARWAMPLLSGLFIFIALTILNAWNIAPHSAWRAAVVAGASGFLASRLLRRFQKREDQR